MSKKDKKSTTTGVKPVNKGTIQAKSVANNKLQVTYKTGQKYRTVSLNPGQVFAFPNTTQVKEVLQMFINQGLIIYTK